MTIRVRVVDALSGVSSINVTGDGRPVIVNATPSLPAKSVTATEEWDGAHVTEGAHTVSVIASDRAGNAASARTRS